MKRTILYISLTVLLAACGKDFRTAEKGFEMSFSVRMADGTRSAGLYTEEDLNTLGLFSVTGYDASTKVIEDQKVTRNGSIWQLRNNPKIWQEGRTMTFWAYANMPPYASLTTESAASATFSVTEIPAEATSQWDPLIGYYSGTGNNGNAPITFHHPLTAVSFKTGDCGDPAKVSAITSVTLKNIHKKGSATVTGSGEENISYAWTTPSDKAEVSGPFSETASTQPFLLIPQNLSDDNVTIAISVKLDGEEDPKTVEAELATGSWEAGYHYFYILDYSPSRPMDQALTVTLADWHLLKNKNDGEYFDVIFGTKSE